jgi:hypothetical protein
MNPRPCTEVRRQRLLRTSALLMICALSGGFDLLNTSAWLARMVTPAEEEEVSGKDRSALIAASHLTRRGGIRPTTTRRRAHPTPPAATAVDTFALSHPVTIRQPLTGAGIYQHC